MDGWVAGWARRGEEATRTNSSSKSRNSSKEGGSGEENEEEDGSGWLSSTSRTSSSYEASSWYETGGRREGPRPGDVAGQAAGPCCARPLAGARGRGRA